MLGSAWFWVFAIVVVVFGFVVFFGAPYVPTFRRDVRRVFRELYPIGARDVLVDLGSGDGVVLREAARVGARAIGYELNPVLVWLSRRLSRRQRKIEVYTGNMWHVTLPKSTTVVYIFAVERDVEKVETLMQTEVNRLQKPVKLISHGLKLPGREPTKTVGAHFLYDFIPLQVKKT